MMILRLMLFLLLVPGLVGIAHAHTIDAVGNYRVEIGWMNEPVVSGETNAIEFFASPLDPCPELEDSIKCAESQPFRDGIEGLKKTVKVQLIYKDKDITLSLSPDHDIPGKYYAFVNPTVSGFYQANMLGNIEETPISLSMHPPKVEERSYIEFPEKLDKQVEEIITEYYDQAPQNDMYEQLDAKVQQVADKQSGLVEDVQALKEPNDAPQSFDMGFVGVGFGIAGVAVAVVALSKKPR